MASEAFNEGNLLFVDELYEEACEQYGEAISAIQGGDADGVTLARVLEARAATHLKLDDHMAALDDANAALQADATSVVAMYRKGLACFHMDEFETAKEAFENAIATAGEDNRKVKGYKKWLRKCVAELESDDEDVVAAIAHTEADNAAAAAAAPAPAPTAAPTPASAPAPAPASAPAPAPAPARSSSSRTMASAVRYDWYESTTTVTIDVMSKNINQEGSEVNFSPTSLEVNLAMKDGSNYVLDIDLAGRVVPDKCRVRYRPVKAEVKLVKAVAAEWGLLEGVADMMEAVPAAVASSETATPVPAKATPAESAPLPAPYAHKKDWSKVERDIENELKDDKPEGEDALRTLFQQIYKDANEDTRRAMIKSFQTSGGTVLSTNWNEVAKADYEKDRQAPDGMEWKKWG